MFYFFSVTDVSGLVALTFSTQSPVSEIKGKIHYWLLCWWTVNFFWLEISQKFYIHHSHNEDSNKYLLEIIITPKVVILQYISLYFIHKWPNFEKWSMKLSPQKCWFKFSYSGTKFPFVSPKFPFVSPKFSFSVPNFPSGHTHFTF